MKKSTLARYLLALLPATLLFLAPATAASADTYEAAWNGGHLTATASDNFTEATIESVSVSFDGCGTQAGEATCSWNAKAILYSRADRCDPTTPEEQVVWESGWQSGNGTVVDGEVGFPLEGCRGQTLGFRLGESKTYDKSVSPPPWELLERASLWPLFTFGYHPFEEAERRIVTANPPASTALPPMPHDLTVAPDCRSLTIGNASYRFVFRHIDCRRASDLATMRHISGRAPSGYHCRNGAGGVVCWRIGHPEKYLEWRPPGIKPIARPHP